MTSYENQILRPAVLLLLGAARDVIVHVAPVEHLTSAGARKRSAAELGKGCPDLLLSVRWRARSPMSGPTGAAWLCMELKAPPCPGSGPEVFVCSQCLRANQSLPWSCTCPGSRVQRIPRWSPGRVSKEQAETHAAWERGGRWVSVVRTPAEAQAALVEARRRLRAAGLEPCAVEGRS